MRHGETVEHEAPAVALIRTRLASIARRLDDAVGECRRAGLGRRSSLMDERAREVRAMLDAPELPRTWIVETAIAQAERALEAWATLISL